MLVESTGGRPPITEDGCIARMVSVGGGGEEVTQVLVLGRLGDRLTRKYSMEEGCPLELDGLFEWARRMLVCRPAVESSESADASRYTSQCMFADALRKHLEGADSTEGGRVWLEVLKQGLPDEHVVDVGDATEDTKELEVLCARLLTPTERDELLPQVQSDWVPVINKSILSDDSSPVREQAHTWPWRKKLGVSFAVGGVVLGSVLTGCLLWRGRFQDDTVLLRPKFDQTHPQKTTFVDAITESTLASLRTAEDVCERAFNASVQYLQPVSRMDWLRPTVCRSQGGRLVCAWRDKENRYSCHSFGIPTKFGFTAVGEAIERYLKPDECAIQCGGEALDLFQQELKELALDDNCSTGCIGDCTLDKFAARTPNCNCTVSILQCQVDDGKGNIVVTGTLVDRHSDPRRLSKHSTALVRQRHKIHGCGAGCLRPIKHPFI
ncbi:hypothetical protein GNI_152860 [Gregarina niphandrodes]|uniref:Uncharacterized protein n=1 Tax=Gregarina niphandrodes TaxID=110365 RepID=A0A023B0B5_GRENI|nr:hypothetical protein GNI_152860 [Gregarina niphandrodes]EZG44066.1 hypothetical protein GNI_152860 [Gregarina niphandrodes]|eukprot:XP_011132823.1 hypothetical protein GNI_152860 [Gregarina niphandrodes]